MTQQQLANLRPFQPGNPGGPGRPVGSRTAFSAGFLRDLAQVWQEHGRDTVVSSGQDPAGHLLCCLRSSDWPRSQGHDRAELAGQPERSGLAGHMREIVEAVKLTVPDARSKPPGEVLEYVRARISAQPSELRTRDINSLD